MINELTKPIPGKEPTKIYAFGGLEEIGKNMYGIEYKDDLIIVDCGIKFANNELLGIDGVVANFSHLKEVGHKLKAVVITHGHEDHIGGLPYLLKEFDVPIVYAPKMASELITRKLLEHKDAKPTKIITYDDFSNFSTKYFKIDFYRVNHSIPDSFGVCIQTPNGNIVESGDYRFDFASKNEELDMHKVVEISKRGISLFMSETTNAEVPGFSPGEQGIYKNIRKIIKEAKGRVFLAAFASNITRINEVVEMALNLNRKICLLGKTMDANVITSRKVGYINIKDSDIVQARDIKKHKDENLMIICTGSQGEEMAALSVMSRDKHPWISLKPEDTIIMSSNPIPGNYANVEHLLNELAKHGVTIFENSPSRRLHASGHATRQELQLMMRLLNPKYLLPIHGEFKMFRSVQHVAQEIGFDKDNVVIVKNGDVLSLIEGELFYTGEVIEADPVYIENKKTSKNSAQVLKERRTLSQEGVFTIMMVLDKQKGIVVGLPIIVTRGCFYAKESGPLLTKMGYAIKQAVDDEIKKTVPTTKNKIDEEVISKIAKNIANYYIWRNKKRNPLITTIVHQI